MANFTRTVLLTMALLGLVSPAVAKPATLNDGVVKFCKDHLGEKVGDGECSSLADAAVAFAGAKPRTAFKEFPQEGDCVWGKLVYALEMKGDSPKETQVPRNSVQPGDVIQFRDARFEGKNLRGFEVYFTTFPHHTAVVLEVKKADHVLAVLEQNVNGKRIVTENMYRLSDLKAGWVRVYRAVPK